jgi:dipeptidyl aminopeptidase/acylaminoacyl peptidase
VRVSNGYRASWQRRFRLPTVGFPRWSDSDPERLVFLSDEGGVTQVWTASLGGNDRRPITSQRVGVEEFVLAPQGDRVAWWSDDSGDGNGAWVTTSIDKGDGHEPLLNGLGAGWSEGLAWCGDRVAVALSDGAAYRVYAGSPGEEGRLVYQSPHPAGLGREWTTSAGGLSTDGSLLCLRHSESGDMLHFALRVLRAEDGSVIGDLVDDGKTMRVASWSPVPGDARVAIVHELDGIERPAVWNPRTGERRNYSSSLAGEIDVLGWFPDGRALLACHWHDGRSELYRLALDSGEYEALDHPRGYVSGAGVRPDGDVWLRVETGAHAPVVRTTSADLVLAPPSEAPPGVDYKSLRFIGPSGEPTHMMVATPSTPGPHPIVMHVHGGPEWADPDAYDPWTATLVEHGVAVATVNYRGSTGFGEAWRTAIYHGNIGIPEVSDVVSGLRYLVDIGIADPARCAIEGWSWGGYVSALAIGLHPDVFAAAIAGIPVCDSVMTHEDCSPSQQAYDIAIMDGSPAEVPERYAERSPSTYLDAVRTPVLIIAGEHDSACPIRQVRWYAEQLEERGQVVQLHVYDAGHHANSVDERVAQVELMLAFLHAQGMLPRPPQT